MAQSMVKVQDSTGNRISVSNAMNAAIKALEKEV